jgi:hypothetical protein
VARQPPPPLTCSPAGCPLGSWIRATGHRPAGSFYTLCTMFFYIGCGMVFCGPMPASLCSISGARGSRFHALCCIVGQNSCPIRETSRKQVVLCLACKIGLVALMPCAARRLQVANNGYVDSAFIRSHSGVLGTGATEFVALKAGEPAGTATWSISGYPFPPPYDIQVQSGSHFLLME